MSMGSKITENMVYAVMMCKISEKGEWEKHRAIRDLNIHERVRECHI